VTRAKVIQIDVATEFSQFDNVSRDDAFG